MDFIRRRKQSISLFVIVVFLLVTYVRTEYTPYVEHLVNEDTVERLADVNPEEIITADKTERATLTAEKIFEFALNEYLHYANRSQDKPVNAAEDTPGGKISKTEDVPKENKQVSSEKTDWDANDLQEQVVTFEFRNDELLSEHFEKHGGEFPYENELDYLIGANMMLKNPNKLHKLEKEDGDDVYYVEETNEFLIMSKDGYIRTYFKPSKGKAYFDRQ